VKKFRVIRVHIIGERTVYKNPTRMYKFLIDPNGLEAFVVLKDEDGKMDIELATDIHYDYSLLKTEEGLFAVKK